MVDVAIMAVVVTPKLKVNSEVDLHPTITRAAAEGRLALDSFYNVVIREDRARGAYADVDTDGERIAGYEALGIDVVACSPGLQQSAERLTQLLRIVWGASEAPPAVIAEVTRVLALWQQSPISAAPWMFVLQNVIADNWRDSQDPCARARDIVSELKDRAIDLPTQFLRDDRNAMTRAGEALLRQATTRGPKPTAWARAVAFARALGVSMPPKPSKANEKRKGSIRARRTD